ncbi:MAG TPA: NADH-quinone oxidoreductase subunit J [Acidimicrobiales bacterium]|jgi:NADH-quinone oxidoreductase subunit J|nr:NADH-quinone oxidoreductase subunit J [Acidimicrobiales bacterium]
MVAQNVFFGILALVMGVSAIRVVTVKNVVHAALYLVLVFAGVAGIFILLAAEFLAVVQVLVYIGAILVLFLFGTMLTRAPIGRTPDLDNPAGQRGLSALVALALFGFLGAILVDAFSDSKVEPTGVVTSSDVALSIFQDYVIPFEVISILLTAALIGAVVIARRD